MLTYYFGRWISLSAAGLLYEVLSAAAVALIFITRRRLRKTLVVWAVVAWCVVALLALADLQIGRRVYFSIMGFDYAVRTAFVSSISTFGVPAENPFFYPGHAVPLRYHYFWLMQAALVHRLAPPFVDARQALIAGTLWCGIALMGTIVLYLRFFDIGVRSLRRHLLIALSLLAVTGLNVVPALLCRSINVTFPFHREDQVDGWVYSLLWEPHYVAALIAGLLAFLLIGPAQGGSGQRTLHGVIAGLALSTSVGAAIYLALIFALFLFCWSVIVLAKRWYAEFQALAVAAVTAVLCSLPYLASLRGPGAGGAFLHLAVRSFFIVEVLGKVLNFTHVWQTSLANLILLPLSYYIELGVFFVAGVAEWQRLRRMPVIPRNDLALGLLVVVSLAACTFLRSGVISINDLGWHGSLPAQFVLLIRGAQLLPAKLKNWLPLLALGLAGTIYDQALVRFFAPLYPSKHLPKVPSLSPDNKLGERTYANREAYDWLRANSLASSRAQQNPDPVIQDTFYGLYADRNTLAEDIECATNFGGDPKACAPLQSILRPVFAAQARETALDSACAALPLDFIVAKDTDAAWRSEESWVWTRVPLFANSFVRIFRCASRPSQSPRVGPLLRP